MIQAMPKKTFFIDVLSISILAYNFMLIFGKKDLSKSQVFQTLNKCTSNFVQVQNLLKEMRRT